LNKPRLFVIAAPSGGGKTSLIAALLKRDDRVSLSVSHTTRPPRPGEIDAVHYHFVDEPAFLKQVEKGAFLEHARVFDHWYGTSRDSVQEILDSGHDVLLDIDWQGARQIKQNFPDCCTIFILPPSLETLRTRLSRRAQDSEEVIDRRMRAARAELSHGGEFDFLIVNDDFDRALADLHSIVRNGTLEPVGQLERNHDLLAQLLN
jgi:guanylate kinase